MTISIVKLWIVVALLLLFTWIMGKFGFGASDFAKFTSGVIPLAVASTIAAIPSLSFAREIREEADTANLNHEETP